MVTLRGEPQRPEGHRVAAAARRTETEPRVADPAQEQQPEEGSRMPVGQVLQPGEAHRMAMEPRVADPAREQQQLGLRTG